MYFEMFCGISYHDCIDGIQVEVFSRFTRSADSLIELVATTIAYRLSEIILAKESLLSNRGRSEQSGDRYGQRDTLDESVTPVVGCHPSSCRQHRISCSSHNLPSSPHNPTLPFEIKLFALLLLLLLLRRRWWRTIRHQRFKVKYNYSGAVKFEGFDDFVVKTNVPILSCCCCDDFVVSNCVCFGRKQSHGIDVEQVS